MSRHIKIKALKIYNFVCTTRSNKKIRNRTSIKKCNHKSVEEKKTTII